MTSCAGAIRLSLILCQRQVPSAGRTLEITTGPDGQDYWISPDRSGPVLHRTVAVYSRYP